MVKVIFPVVANFAHVLGIAKLVLMDASSSHVISAQRMVAAVAHTLGIVLLKQMRAFTDLSLWSITSYLFFGSYHDFFLL